MFTMRRQSCHQVTVSERSKTHSRTKLSDEEFSAIVETNEPLIVLLEYTFACNSMLSQNSIEARLSGVRLPTTVVKFDAIVINLSNQIAVETHIGNAVNCLNGSVCFGPILIVVADGNVHESFDLAHEVSCLVDFYTIHEMREGTTDAVPLPQVSLTKEGEVSIQDKINDFIRCRAVEPIAEPIHCHLR